MSSKLSEKSGKVAEKRFFHSERPTRELSLYLVKSQNRKGRGRKAKNVKSPPAKGEAQVGDIYEFAFDPESEPKTKKKSKIVRKKRAIRRVSLPYDITRKTTGRAAKKPTASGAIAKTPDPSEEMPQRAAVNSKIIETSAPSEKQGSSVNVKASNSSEKEDNLPQETHENIEGPIPTKNQNNATQKTNSSHGILKPSKPILKLHSTPLHSGIQNYPESPGFDFVKNFEERFAGSGGKKRVNFSTPLANKNQVLPMNASFVDFSPLPMSTPHGLSTSSILPRNTSATMLSNTSSANRSPWRIDSFLPLRSNTVNSPMQSPKQTPVTHRTSERETGILRDISNVTMSQKRQRLSLSKSSKQPKTHNQEGSRSDALNFGFEDSDELSTSDRSPEHVPDKNILHLHRSLVREFFSRSVEKHKSRPATRHVNDENAVPELPLFHDPAEPKSNVEEDLTEKRDIPYRLRKPKLIRRLSLTDSDEESVVPSPKKRGRVEDCDNELESFAKEFNSMCEEVQKYELVVEPKRN